MSALKVLIFEYDRPFADALERAFVRRGCSVRVVDDGQVGLDVALDDRPGLIILAIELPRMNGFAVCNRIKKHPDLKDIPLVIVSSDSPPETFEQHSKLRTRAEDYAHKPIDPEALIARAAAFVDIPRPRESEIMVDDEVIEEAADDAPIDLDDVGGLTDAAFDHIALDDAPATAPMSAASLLEPPPDRPATPRDAGDDFDDFTMVSSGSELSLDLAGIARAVEANPPPAKAPPPLTPAPLPPAPAPLSPAPLSPAPLTPAALPSFAAPPPLAPPTPPPPAPTAAQLEAARLEAEGLQRQVESLERELAAARASAQRAAEVTAENQRLREQGEELSRLNRDLEEKVRASAAPAAGPARAGGVSTREFLELRESLNRKDKDILARDRELLELRDKLLQVEMSSADADDRLAERDAEVAAARAEAETARTSFQAESARRADLERALDESRRATSEGEVTLRQQLAEAEARREREAESHQQALAALRAELDAARAEHERAVEAERAESRALAQRGEAAVRAEHEAALEAARAEHGSLIAALRSEHAQVVDSLRADYSTGVEPATAAHGRALQAQSAEHAAALEAAKAEHEQRLDALSTERAAALAAATAAEDSTRRELTDRVTSLDSELSASRAQGAALAADLAAATARADEAARDAASLRDRLGALERRQAASEGLLDRARQALEIAAGLVHAAANEPTAEDAAARDA